MVYRILSLKTGKLSSDGEEYFSKNDEEIFFIDGGKLSSIIFDNKEGFIGGNQADLAPHGKGNGWGNRR